jgi:hypothetical protein
VRSLNATSLAARSLLVVAVVSMVAACSGGTHKASDPRVAAFDAWVDEVLPVFAGSGGGPGMRFDRVNCVGQLIGYEAANEPACRSIQGIDAGEQQVVLTVRWAVASPSKWLAYAELDLPVSFECEGVQSSAEYYRGRYGGMDVVACRTGSGGEAFLTSGSNGATVTFLSAAFVQAYPGYVSSMTGQAAASS